VFVLHHALRAAVTPVGRGRGARPSDAAEEPMPKTRGRADAALERVFAIEIETCQHRGGKLEAIASIEDAERTQRILIGARPWCR
jgi:hypothetical protein